VTAPKKATATGELLVDNLIVRYGPIQAVNEVSLKVSPGQIVAVVGANGAGKSSLLMAISGYAPISGGEVALDGRRINGSKAHFIARSGVAHVPEGRRIFGQMTVRENLALGIHLRSDRVKADSAFKDVWDLFPELEEKASQKAFGLSGGQQQMLAIARALVANPSIYLLDEPSLGLAPVVVDRLYGLIERLRERAAVLVVEQNVRAVLDIADYAYVLRRGTVGLEGPARALRDDDRLSSVLLGVG
jgi:branched-chain amino acid transport system ATP-binding protein